MRSCAHVVPHTGGGARARAEMDRPGGTCTGQGTYVATDPRALELGRSGGDRTASHPMRSISTAHGRCSSAASAMKLRRSMGLTTKLNVLTIGLILITSISIALFLLHQKRSRDHAELLEYAGHLARILADNSEYGVYTENRDALNGVMNSVAAAKEISYVVVVNRSGRELARRQVARTVP